MYKIFLNSKNEALSFNSFKDKMIEICNSHREKNKALAFAFILYDFENPQISKVLNDEEYWLALNKISGEYLSVFSINYKVDDVGMEKTAFLTSLSYSNDPSEATNELINTYFGEEVEAAYPAVLFFQVNEEEVIDSLLIELEEERMEDSFIELKKLITVCVDVLKKINKENSQNYKEIFDLIEIKMKANKNAKIIKRVTKTAGKVINLAAAVVSIV